MKKGLKAILAAGAAALPFVAFAQTKNFFDLLNVAGRSQTSLLFSLVRGEGLFSLEDADVNSLLLQKYALARNNGELGLCGRDFAA